MKIGIILHPYDEDRPAGLARTIFEYTKGMLEVDHENDYVIFVKKEPRQAPDLPGKNWRLESLGGGRLWLERLRSATPVDVCVFNTPIVPFFYRPKRSVVIALDFAYWTFGWNGFRQSLNTILTYAYHWFSLRRADHIVAISEATKRETVRLFGVDRRRISVARCGYKPMCALPEAPVTLPERFFLYVGVFKERKNVVRLVEAFSLFASKNQDVFLVLAGNARGAYGDRVRALVRTLGIGERVVFVDFPTDEQLSYIYRRPVAVVFPSLIEGFGYPVLEGMDCGVPVITSNQSSLSEVGGDAAVLVDPFDQRAIAEAMRRLATDRGMREDLIRKGHERTKQFSWQKAGRDVLDILGSLG
jgi:glycosyltransferase involved in cell wall biosynthesis